MSEGFDVVVGADIIYEAEHARWIRECLIRLLKPGAEFHLVIPLRKTHAVECETVERVFGLERELGILGRERIRCRGDGDDVVEYSYYRIGWC
ncbi:hypothetical protein BDV98DRAFT_559316 [Pterulicium gracile]|uniref:Methyltransferase-domain-containing protein n=1 Tax=Pterulicium gracile TaxID=1884261 RepID=A0A5C3R0S7_9AGAR|nr:hypothetical protein BDV98DRAFT_559316 [Pterula gracilis]